MLTTVVCDGGSASFLRKIRYMFNTYSVVRTWQQIVQSHFAVVCSTELSLFNRLESKMTKIYFVTKNRPLNEKNECF